MADLHLGIESLIQYFILFFNPLPTSLFIVGFALYFKKVRSSYLAMFLLSFASSLLLFSNVVYFREFSDVITINTMLGAGKVSSGLGESALRLFRPYDFLYFIDTLVFLILFFMKKLPIPEKKVKKRYALAVTSLSILLFSINLTMAEADRPELLKRTFSHDYIVKYLGINVFTAYDGVQTYKTNQTRATASATDLDKVQDYINQHQVAANPKMFGIAKGRNVIYIHLESLQQFVIDFKLKDKNGKEHVVTPFLNSLYHSKSTYSFSNFFHQVKSGKTSDAETLFENSYFGLDQGPLFTQLGSKNTFQAAPAILGQTQGYTSAVFHGNAGTFWNRNDTYKRFGYDYFFDSSYYNVTEKNSFQYGLHDKPFFEQSVQYLEHLQQPFYTKFLAVSNHYPYSEFKNDEAGFPMATTSDETINGYFATANYLDTAVEEFFNYLKASGLYEKSIIVLYGDHYGISNSRNPNLAPLLGKEKETWNDYDDAQMQRVPYMIHIPGQSNGYISTTYGGQVDALPTLLHLLGVDTKKYLLFGQDLFSQQRNQIVAFRNGSFMTPDYTGVGDVVYDNKTQQPITDPDSATKNKIDQINTAVDQQLANSDALTNGDLLRYAKNSFKPVDATKYNYKNELSQLEKIEKEKGVGSTSLYSKKQDTSTVNLYKSKTYKQYHPTADDKN